MCARICRITLMTVLLATSAIVLSGDDARSDASDSHHNAQVAAGQNYGVRLRKLHLVRPDLIPYPLSLEVYC